MGVAGPPKTALAFALDLASLAIVWRPRPDQPVAVASPLDMSAKAMGPSVVGLIKATTTVASPVVVDAGGGPVARRVSVTRPSVDPSINTKGRRPVELPVVGRIIMAAAISAMGVVAAVPPNAPTLYLGPLPLFTRAVDSPMADDPPGVVGRRVAMARTSSAPRPKPVPGPVTGPPLRVAP